MRYDNYLCGKCQTVHFSNTVIYSKHLKHSIVEITENEQFNAVFSEIEKAKKRLSKKEFAKFLDYVDYILENTGEIHLRNKLRSQIKQKYAKNTEKALNTQIKQENIEYWDCKHSFEELVKNVKYIEDLRNMSKLDKRRTKIDVEKTIKQIKQYNAQIIKENNQLTQIVKKLGFDGEKFNNIILFNKMLLDLATDQAMMDLGDEIIKYNRLNTFYVYKKANSRKNIKGFKQWTAYINQNPYTRLYGFGTNKNNRTRLTNYIIYSYNIRLNDKHIKTLEHMTKPKTKTADPYVKFTYNLVYSNVGNKIRKYNKYVKNIEYPQFMKAKQIYKPRGIYTETIYRKNNYAEQIQFFLNSVISQGFTDVHISKNNTNTLKNNLVAIINDLVKANKNMVLRFIDCVDNALKTRITQINAMKRKNAKITQKRVFSVFSLRMGLNLLKIKAQKGKELKRLTDSVYRLICGLIINFSETTVKVETKTGTTLKHFLSLALRNAKGEDISIENDCDEFMSKFTQNTSKTINSKEFISCVYKIWERLEDGNLKNFLTRKLIKTLFPFGFEEFAVLEGDNGYYLGK
nr:MAG: hypothetical protein [Lokiarchaeota virus Fenrir Meg22_1012]URC17180.1 MAG: hypothetical protein [Lokiarchaeota virus Fenrir Meg22_1214]